MAPSTTMTTLGRNTSTTGNTTSPEQPRRNLTQAFEALCSGSATHPRHHHPDTDELHKEEKSDVHDPPSSLSSPNTIRNNNNAPTPTPLGVAKPNTNATPIIMDVSPTSVIITGTNPHAAAASCPLPAKTNATPPPSSAAASSSSSTNPPGTTQLNPRLRGNLSLYCIQRVARYSILHDINKEAVSLAGHDPLLLIEQHPSPELECPLVRAATATATGPVSTNTTTTSSIRRSCTTTSNADPDPSTPTAVLIDEEKWLLTAIAERSPQETAGLRPSQCPATFLQAMGETEYDTAAANVHTTTNSNTATHGMAASSSIAGTTNNSTNYHNTNTNNTTAARTQLWKPSRSWWEAKSGKNPWIEPACHNKRWRYLWPLIHYHKFLHKCIKKLKRNGVDVVQSSAVSPVSVFLREEVCAVSDHLAAVSLFGSDEWMECLQQFTGWTSACFTSRSDATTTTITEEQEQRRFVSNLPLRSFSWMEPGDVDSPILRSQIDEAFLRSLAAQRDPLREYSVAASSHKNNSSSSQQPPLSTGAATTTTTMAGVLGPPPMYPRGGVAPTLPLPVPRQIHGGARRQRYYHPNTGGGNWYGWDGSGILPQDASSVHSELSANSFPQPQPQALDPNAHLAYSNVNTNTGTTNMYQHPHYFHHHLSSSSEHSHSTGGFVYPDQFGGWMDPSMAYAMHHHQHHHQFYSSSHHYPPQTDLAPQAETSKAAAPTETTPFKFDPENSNSMSPYWSHLDQATLAMGLATPAEVTPSTPMRRRQIVSGNKSLDQQDGGDDDEYPSFHAQAPLLRQQYYGFDAVPPSPATQFMMSPQASFAYNYGYGFSPTRMQRRASRHNYKTSTTTTPLKPVERRSLSPTHTIETATESESLEHPPTVATAI